jgi:hypothetical protein
LTFLTAKLFALTKSLYQQAWELIKKGWERKHDGLPHGGSWQTGETKRGDNAIYRDNGKKSRIRSHCK